jgi:O-antigen ligase
MSAAIVFSAWKAARKLRGSPWFPLAFVIFWYSFVLLFAQTFAGMQSYQDFLMNAYLWLLLGILFRLPSLGLAAQQTAVAEQTARSERRWMR